MSSDERETKFSKGIRGFISFVLFLLLVLLSLTVCAKASFLNEQTIEKQFTGFDYTAALRTNVTDYAKDACMRQGISDRNVDRIFSLDAVGEAVKSYYGYYISDKIEYSEQSYKKYIQAICAEFEGSIENQLKQDGADYKQSEVNALANDVSGYFENAVRMPYMDKAKSVLNVTNVALYAVIGVSAFFVLSLMLIEYFVGKKRQRSVRAIAVSFASAGLYELFLALLIYIVSLVKKVDIFPVYLSRQFMNYVYTAIGDIALCGVLMLFVFVILTAVVWKIRKGK